MAYDWNNQDKNQDKPKKKGFSFASRKANKKAKNDKAALGAGSNYKQQQVTNSSNQQYDWFRNGTQGEKGGWKQAGKTTWKFTKIFLYLSVFIFSLWGCVQSFTMKPDPNPGAGYEMYLADKYVSPHSTNFVVETNTKGVTSIYNDGKTIWLSDKTNYGNVPPSKGVSSALSASHNDLASQGIHRLAVWDKAKHEALFVNQDYLYATSSAVSKLSAAQRANASKELDTVIATPITIKVWDTNKNKFIDVKLDPTKDIDNLSQGYKDEVYANYRLFDAFYNHPKVHEIFDTTRPMFTWTKAPSTDIDREKFEAYRNATSIIFGGGSYFHFSLGETANPNPAYDSNSPTYDPKAPKYIGSGEYVGHYATGWWDRLLNTDATPNSALPFIVKRSSQTAFQALGPFGLETYHPINTWKQAWVHGTGPFYALFVFPLSKLMDAILQSMPIMSGWEIIIGIMAITLITRMISFMFTFKSLLQQTKTQELQAKKAIIDQKYEAYKGNKQMENRKRQEVQELYKKEGISPLGSLGSLLITMPIFLSVWRVISGTPHIKAGEWAGLVLSKTSYKEVFSGNWIYLWIIIAAASFNGFSAYFPRLLTKRRDKNRTNVQQRAALKKNNRTQNIMIIVQVVMALIFSAGTQVYWIIISLWRIGEQLITHRIIIRQRQKNKRKKIKA